MARGHEELYSRLETRDRLPADYITRAEEIPCGWTEPPERLLTSYRSFFLRSANADEQKNLTYLARMRPRRLDFEPYGVAYGGAFIYPLGAYYATLSVFQLLTVTSDLRAYFRDIRKMARVFLAGRAFNVLCFLCCALALYRIGCASGSSAEGLFSALFFLVSPVACLVEHTLNPYGWATLWFLMGCRWIQAYLASGARQDLLKGSAAVGLCVGSTPAFWPTAFLLSAPVFFARRHGHGLAEAAVRTTQAMAGLGAVFVLTNPYLFLRFDKYAYELVYVLQAFPFSLTPGRLWAFLADFLVRNWGGVLTSAALAGIGTTLMMRGSSPLGRLFSATFLAGLLQLAGHTSDFTHGRHFLPFFALGSLAAGNLLWSRFPARLRGAAWALSAALLLDSGSISASYLWNFHLEARHKSTRLEAGRWIGAHVSQGASIGLVAPPQPSDTPPFRFERHALVLFERPDQLRGRQLPDYVVLSELRASQELKAFLGRHYREAAFFRPRRLLPWVPVRGLYALANIELGVYQKLPL